MKRLLVLTILLAAIFHGFRLQAQVTTQPSPALESKAVQLIYDASQGNAGLKDYASDIYAHIGVITNKSTGGSDWRYVKASWPNATNQAEVNKAEWKLTRSSSNSNLYTLDLKPSIREYFGVPAGETIQKIALVFRNADGAKTGKTSSGGDIFVDVSPTTVALKVTSPLDGSTYIVGDDIPVAATANATKIELFVDGVSQFSTATSPLTYTFKPTQPKTYLLKIVATDAANAVEEVTTTINVLAPPAVEPLPDGARPGLTIKDGKATFVLQAPNKKFCSLIGSFNSYLVSAEYSMKQTPDKQYFWITLNNLQNDTDYSYQYLVDGSVKVADPYSSLVLDPWNDSYIKAETFPNLPAYPTDKTTGIVSSFRMNPPTYTWQNTSFKPASNEKLNIYEVLIRDFIAKHDFKTLTDTLKYFKSIGVNAIELMPINEFEGNSSWGYNPSFYFAVDKYYGPANDLKKFVDECHKQGIAVIIDLVLNHSFSQSPLVQLYYNKTTNKVTPDNPWYNVESPNSTYSWGYDFNHESKYTQAFVDSVNAYWMSEFKVDGYRFDFTKGFTQKSGDGSAYDASRIAILNRMNAEIKKRNSNAIVIFEHLADNAEEKELTSAGILLWGNVNNNSCEAAMGYNDGGKSDLTWASYKARGWNNPNLVAYMESHDEERVGYKQETWGASNGSYNVKDLAVATQRHAALAAVFLSIPGPKMIWQWQELGYDHSINECENGTVDNNGGCRTSPKPLFWDKNTSVPANADRLNLKSVFGKMMELRSKYAAFSTADFKDSLRGAVKYILLRDSEMNVISVGNFDIATQQVAIPITGQGYYYSNFAKDSVKIENGKLTLQLKAGEFHVLTSKRLFNALKLSITSPKEADKFYLDETISISATTVAPKATLFVNNEKIADFSGNVTYKLSPAQVGSYTIKVVATSGADVETKSVTVSVQNRPITISIESPTANQAFFVGDIVKIKGSATNTSKFEIKVNNEVKATGTNSASYDFTPTEAGTYYIQFVGTNSNETKEETVTIQVKQRMQPMTFGPNPVRLGGDLKFFYPENATQENATISVYTLNGKLVGSAAITIDKLNPTIKNTSNLGMTSQGIYLIHIRGKNIDVKEKIVII